MNNSQSIRSDIEMLLSGQNLAVLSTSSPDGHPYASLVCVVAEDDLSSIYFATSRHTRKFGNLSADPRVAILVENSQNRQSDIEEAMAVTAVGTAGEVDGSGAGDALDLYQAKHPKLSAFVAAPDTALLRIDVKAYYLVNRFQQVATYHVK